MRIGILILAILCCSYGEAQNRFFTFVEGWVNNASLETADGYLVMGLGNVGFPPVNHFLRYNFINTEGSITNYLEFEVDTVLGTSSQGQSNMMIQIPNGNYLSAGILVRDEAPVQYGVIYEYDPISNLISVRSTLNDASLTQFWGLAYRTDTTYSVIGLRANGLNQDARVYRFNINGDLIWETDFFWGGEQQRTRPHDLITLNSGHTAALFWEIDSGQPAFHDRWRVRLTLLNDLGQIVWNRYPGDHENYRIRPGGITEQDGDILVAFSDPEYYDETGEWQPSPSNRVRFELYDTLGTLLSSDSLDELNENINARRTVSQIQHLTDGNLLVSGYHELQHGFLAKITPDLETIWLERYSPYEYTPGVFDFNTQILNTIETSDGGFLCTGMFSADPGSEPHPSGIQTAIALKVDQYGCLIENCQVGLEEYVMGSLSVYPNPVGASLNVSLPQGVQVVQVTVVDAMGRCEDLRFDINGQGILSSQISDFKSSSGLYSIIITSRDGRMFTGKFVIE